MVLADNSGMPQVRPSWGLAVGFVAGGQKAVHATHREETAEESCYAHRFAGRL
jgi:hypothetical protein